MRKESIISTHNYVLDSWDYNKNDFGPENYSSGSGKKVWWICKKKHSWSSAVHIFIKGHRCPYCSGRLPIVGKTDLLTTNPKLAKEWNYKKNNLSPTEVKESSGKKVWWECKEGHEWESKVQNRANGNDCPYCSRRFAVVGKTDLATTHPELVREWNYSRNEMLPIEVSRGSNKKVWWKCKLGHEWKTSVSKRATRGDNCPFCSNQRLLVGFNDFASLHPELLKEWDYSKNTILPNMIIAASGKKVWWMCKKGHSWKASPSTRISQNTGCQRCNQSNGEKELSQFCVKIANEKIILNDRKLIAPYELDIVIPELQLAIEYNGEYWHSDKRILASRGVSAKEFHQMKVNKCREQGMSLLFVWEDDWNGRKDIVKTALQEYFENRVPNTMFERLE